MLYGSFLWLISFYPLFFFFWRTCSTVVQVAAMATKTFQYETFEQYLSGKGMTDGQLQVRCTGKCGTSAKSKAHTFPLCFALCYRWYVHQALPIAEDGRALVHVLRSYVEEWLSLHYGNNSGFTEVFCAVDSRHRRLTAGFICLPCLPLSWVRQAMALWYRMMWN